MDGVPVERVDRGRAHADEDAPVFQGRLFDLAQVQRVSGAAALLDDRLHRGALVRRDRAVCVWSLDECRHLIISPISLVRSLAPDREEDVKTARRLIAAPEARAALTVRRYAGPG